MRGGGGVEGVCIMALECCALHASGRERRVHLVLLAERPELGANFGRVEAGVRCCWFDSLGVVFEFHICRPLEARLVLLNEQHRVLQEGHAVTHRQVCVCVKP